MKLPDNKLEIRTLGCFRMLVDGKPVATNWPDETAKVLFCSLLSPLDLYFTWDRICRSLLSGPETQSSRRQLEIISIRPLNSFLIKELGFNPVITGDNGLRIDQSRIHVDAFEFRRIVIEGLRFLSFGNHTAALDNFRRAISLYVGSYLPGIPGKIITNTRLELETYYRTAVIQTRMKRVVTLINRNLPVI